MHNLADKVRLLAPQHHATARHSLGWWFFVFKEVNLPELLRITNARIAQKRKKQNRLAYEKSLIDEISEKSFSLSENEFFIAGLALYWAEGAKKEYSLAFVNSDPNMLVFFTTWLKKCWGIQNSQIKARIQIHEIYKDRFAEVQKYWEKTLHIAPEQFTKPFFQKSKTIAFQREKYYGLVRIRANGTRNILVKILGHIEVFRALANQV